LEVDSGSGAWSLVDKASGVRWPTEGAANIGQAAWLGGAFDKCVEQGDSLRLVKGEHAVVFSLVDEGRAVEIRYETPDEGEIRVGQDALAVTDAESGSMIVPCREGLLIPADSGKAFNRTFGASEYEGCHMNMLAFMKSGSGLIVTWRDAYTFPEVISELAGEKDSRQRLTAAFQLRKTARTLRLMPIGKADVNAVAEHYRRYADAAGLAVTLNAKIRRNGDVERMIGASNAKLWTCLDRRRNEESTADESVEVHWTFDEAAQIAEHLKNDLWIDKCFFMVGGWTEGGYDCRHPDNLPANPECGGNDKLAEMIERIRALGYLDCLHDNVQDMYRDAKSWDESYIEKRPDGTLIAGGRWLGGRAYMVCAPKQLELAQRPQNLPDIHRLFKPASYFIDTTYAVGPRECFDPAHPIGRNDDIAWKIKLSDYAREVFGIFGSECGREWALPHSDFFEGLVGVSGGYYHQLKPQEYGAIVIPFWEMVYRDCQIAWGKYDYSPEKVGEYVAHHVLCARPLHYHSFPDHLYWKGAAGAAAGPDVPDDACFTRCDNGWAAGMHPWDVFLKNTHEILGPLHAATARDRLENLEFVTPDKMVRRAVYGRGADATGVIVNFGTEPARLKTRLGGEVVLPRWGFVVEGPRFAAFYALKWAGVDYGRGAMFAVRAMDDRRFESGGPVQVFHAFGPATIAWAGEQCRIDRQAVIGKDR
jgi:hypothetical protein